MARILVVEDDPDTRMMFGKLVDIAGHDIAFATNGWEALLLLENDSIELILLDLMMPGMDGGTFLKILRNGSRHKDIPVVVITAMDAGDIAKKTEHFAVVAILQKNAGLIDRLVEIIGQTLSPPIKRRADSEITESLSDGESPYKN